MKELELMERPPLGGAVRRPGRDIQGHRWTRFNALKAWEPRDLNLLKDTPWIWITVEVNACQWSQDYTQCLSYI